MKRSVLFINIMLCFILIFTVVQFYRTGADNKKSIIKVSIKGQAKNTGVYFVRDGFMLSDLISLIGGYKYNAVRIKNVNIKLTNEAVINIERKYKLKK